MSRVLIAQPGYGPVEPESWAAASKAVSKGDGHQATILRTRSSLLAHNFNDCLAVCLNNSYDYFAMLHVDMNVPAGWITKLMVEMDECECDVIHAPAAIKDGRGLTSTAIAYADEDWGLTRRITTTELNNLPETFTVETIRDHLDADAKWLLPNTGCMLMRADSWLKDFPGFEVRDRIRRHTEEIWVSEVLPEDWNFGLWCGRNGIEVAGTRKVVTEHFGRVGHSSNQTWGQETDSFWADRQSGVAPVKMEVQEV